LLKNNPDAKISLIYCAKKIKDLVFRQEFDALQSEKFKVHYVLSDEENFAGGSCGFLSADIIKSAMLDMKNPLYYICGSESLKKTAHGIIESLGVAKKRIIIEDFFW
jgi:ferredoxin-NADP reductase